MLVVAMSCSFNGLSCSCTALLANCPTNCATPGLSKRSPGGQSRTGHIGRGDSGLAQAARTTCSPFASCRHVEHGRLRRDGPRSPSIWPNRLLAMPRCFWQPTIQNSMRDRDFGHCCRLEHGSKTGDEVTTSPMTRPSTIHRSTRAGNGGGRGADAAGLQTLGVGMKVGTTTSDATRSTSGADVSDWRCWPPRSSSPSRVGAIGSSWLLGYAQGRYHVADAAADVHTDLSRLDDLSGDMAAANPPPPSTVAEADDDRASDRRQSRVSWSTAASNPTT